MNGQYWDKVLNNIDDELLQHALKTRAHGAAGSTQVRSGASSAVRKRKSVRRISRSALIAAVLACFFAVTALAATIWKLSDRTISTELSLELQGEDSAELSWLSLAGVNGSNEYRAAQEWLQWSVEYTQSQSAGWIDDDWEPADPAMKKAAVFYPCFDDTMVEKLKEIAGRYSLKLHSESVMPLDMAQLYELAGTADFLLAEDVWAVPKYIYEDGSFDIEGADYNDKMFSMIRSMSGTLPPASLLLWNAENAVEWSYTNFSGDMLSIATTQSRGVYSSYIFYSENNAHIILATELGDRAQIEALADCFDFSAACGGEAGVTDYANAPPRATAAPQSISLAAFAESPEYKGIREFMDFRQLQGMLLPYYKGVFPVSEDSLYASYGEEERRMLDALERRVCGEDGICETYGLKAHSSFVEYHDYAEACEAAGVSDFLKNGTEDFFSLRLYEDGSFDMNEGFFYYIKKGSLCTTTHQVVTWLKAEDYSQSWQYETSSGAVVCCALGTNQGSLILFETPAAWVLIPSGGNEPPQQLELLAENYNFTKLP